jgi:hypothetical protein
MIIRNPDHLKTGLFDNRTQIDHPNTGLVRYLDVHCSMLNDSSPIVYTGVMNTLSLKDVVGGQPQNI